MTTPVVPYTVRLRDALGRATRARGLLCWCRAGQRPRALELGGAAYAQLLTSADPFEVDEFDGVVTWRGIPVSVRFPGDPDSVVVRWPPKTAHAGHADPITERLDP